MEQKTVKWKNSLLCMAGLVLLAGVTCYILLKDHSMGTLWEVLKNADLRFVLLGLFLMVMFVGCEAAVIRLLAGTWGGRVLWKRAMQYSFAGFYFSSITPSSTGGQPMQLYYMVRDGMSAARSSFALLTITAMYQLMALVYGVGMGIAKFSYLIGLPLALRILICFGILANGISVAFILLILLSRPLVERLVFRVIRLLNRFPSFDGEKAARKAGSMIGEYSQGGAYLRKYPMAAVKTAVLTFCQLTFLYMASYCACLALGFGSVGLVNFIMLQSIVSLAVSAVPLPGAVGVSESGFLAMFGGFLSSSQLLPVMVLSRGISFYGFLVVSGLAVATLHIGKRGTQNQKQKKKKEKRVRSQARGPIYKEISASPKS